MVHSFLYLNVDLRHGISMQTYVTADLALNIWLSLRAGPWQTIAY
jgi:hypothetical protein